VWDGQALPDNIECSCGNATLRHRSYPENSAIQYAKLFPAGSETFFYTDFTRAFGKHTDEERGRIYSDEALHAQLGAQSILPLAVPLRDCNMDPRLLHKFEDSVGHTKLIITNHNAAKTKSPSQDLDLSLPLYNLNMPLDGPGKASLQLTVKYRNVLRDTSAVPSLYLIYRSDKGPEKRHEQRFQLLLDKSSDAISSLSTKISCPTASNHKVRLKELGIHLRRTASEEVVPILEILSICIIPAQQDLDRETHSISSIRISERGEGENKHLRLCWTISDTTGQLPATKGSPYSPITGSISYFVVQLDGLNVGKAYACECIISQEVAGKAMGREVEVHITAVGFDARALCERTVRLPIASLAGTGVDPGSKSIEIIGAQPS
jgi:hypothetical protein